MITYSVFEEEGTKFVSVTVDDGESISTGIKRQDELDVPLFLREAEPGDTFNEQGEPLNEDEELDGPDEENDEDKEDEVDEL